MTNNRPYITLPTEYGEPAHYEVLCTFSYRKEFYFIAHDKDHDKDYDLTVCEKFGFTPWSGIYEKAEFHDEIISISNEIEFRSIADPEKYPMKGENYIVREAESEEQSGAFIISKCKKPLFFLPLIKTSATPLKLIAAIVIAIIYAFFFFNSTGFRFAVSVFPKLSLTNLKIFLIALEIICSTAIFTIRSNDRSLCDFYLNALIPLNLLTVIAIAQFNKIIRIIMIFVICSVFFKTIAHVFKAIVSNKSALNAARKSLNKAYMPILILVTVFVLGSSVLDLPALSTISTTAKTACSSEEAVRAHYSSALNNINIEVWETLDEQERVDTLQSIADYECVFTLGCGTVIVQSGYMESRTLGDYSNISKKITINVNHIKNDPVNEVVDSLLHEVRHCYQHAAVEALNVLEKAIDDNDMIRLSMFQYAVTMRNSFETYQISISGDDFYDYYNQDVEFDARHWAEARMMLEYDYYIFG